MVVMQLRIGEKLGPRAMAQGLMALASVVLGAVKMEDLFASGDSDSWTDMLDQVFTQSNVRPGQVTLPAEEAKLALEYALALDLRSAAELARDVLEALLRQFWQHSPAQTQRMDA
jgi:hypothetical protein